MKALLSFAIAATLGVFASTAHAQVSCDDLKKILFYEADNFEQIKGSWDEDLEEWTSRFSLPGAECFVSYQDEDTANSFYCEFELQSEGAAKQMSQQILSNVRSCFSGLIEGERTYQGRVNETRRAIHKHGGKVQVSLPLEGVYIEVDSSSASFKYNQGQLHKATLTIDAM